MPPKAKSKKSKSEQPNPETSSTEKLAKNVEQPSTSSITSAEGMQQTQTGKRSSIKYLIAIAVVGIVISFNYHVIVQFIREIRISIAILGNDEPLAPLDNDGIGRIIAVGDLHGDYENAVKTLKMAGVIDSKTNWCAGHSTFVQTGDIVDRGDDTIILYKLMIKLRDQAEQRGGKVVALLGNHEVLNMGEVLTWVTPGDIASFGGEERRKHAWSAQGWIGKYLRQLGIAANVNGTVFFHGGASPKWAIKNVDGLNVEATQTLGLSAFQIQIAPIFGDDGPIWYRGFANDPEWKICKFLEESLRLFGAKRVAKFN